MYPLRDIRIVAVSSNSRIGFVHGSTNCFAVVNRNRTLANSRCITHVRLVYHSPSRFCGAVRSHPDSTCPRTPISHKSLGIVAWQ